MIEEIKVVFLDIDGVLNSLRSFTAFKPNKLENPDDDLELETRSTCDPVSVKLINMIIEQTNAKIVVSSSHRIYFHSRYSKDKSITGFNLNKLQLYIYSLGIIGEIIDATPILDGEKRGIEVDQWLSEFPAKFPQYALGQHAIFDDMTDFLPEQASKLVLSTFDNGFSIDNYKQARLILGVN
jgi:hypothetical protein